MNLIEEKLRTNLIQTKNFINENPNAMFPINHKNIVQMIDYALANWDNQQLRLLAMKKLAEKEFEIKAKGHSNDKDSNIDEGYFQSIFELLLEEAVDESVSGWGDLKNWVSKEKEKISQKKQERKKIAEVRKADRKENGSKLFNTINRLNPATVAARNALRVLVSLNIFGIASILNTQKAREKGVFSKAENLYFNVGGIKSTWDKSIKTGASKKPFLNKKLREKLEKGQLKGLGVDPATDSLLAVAGGFILKILKWIKDAGLNDFTDDIDKNKDDKLITTNNDSNNMQDEYDDLDLLKPKDNKLVNINDNSIPLPNPFIPNQNTSDQTSKPKETSTDNHFVLPLTPEEIKRKNNQKKIILGTIGIVGLGATAMFLIKIKPKKISQTKLSGITFK